jgi:hypothetical protein
MTRHRLSSGVLAVVLAGCASSAGQGADADAADASVDVAGDEGLAADPAEETPPETAGDVVDADVAPEAVEHAGVRAEQEGNTLVLGNGLVVLRFDLATGRYGAEAADGTTLLAGAESRVLFPQGDDVGRIATSVDGTSSWTATATDHAWGSGVSVEVTRIAATAPGSAPVASLADTFELLSGATFFTASTIVIWPAGTEGVPARVTRISPLVLDADTGGALYVGTDPMTHRVLDDGSEIYFDFESKMYALIEGATIQFGPGTASNWNLGLHDPASGRSVVAGFLTSDRGVGVIGLDHDPSIAKTDDGRKAFTRFEGLTHFMDGRAPIAGEGDARSLASETLYVDLLPATPFDGLEGFARFYAKRIGKKVWTDIPSGWNSWGGGSGSGGLGQEIDEPRMLANLALAAVDLAPWGMKHFMIDDGWQQGYGDWEPRSDRFPPHDGVNGMKWLAKQVRDRGMIPGLWIAPFSANKGSKLAKDHPDWFCKVGGFGVGLVGDQLLLDLSRPEVLDWLEAKFREIAEDWGYRWFKVDFSYYALFATALHDPDVTPTEVYRKAVARIRKAVGPDSFLLGISATGLWFDDGDGNRITLDNEPWWGDPVGSGDQGIKVTYKTVAHRYYLSHNVWINHPDLLFFRPDYGLTANEARAWASAVAITGGIVKLGETYEAMHAHPEWLDVIRPMLPVYPRSGRPLDLFQREYPEVWDLAADRDGRSWHVVGLFHWGKNRDAGSSKWDEEAPRTVGVDRAALGLAAGTPLLAFDAWARTWEWLDGPRVERLMDPRTGVLLVVREKPADPAVVFTTRHLMGGAVEVHDETWDPVTGTLKASVDAVPGVPITVYVAAADRTVLDATVDGGTGMAPSENDGVLALPFTPQSTFARLTVRFTPQGGT